MNKEYSNNILTAGLVLGVLYTAVGSFLPYIAGDNATMNALSFLLGAAVIAWALITYGRKAAALKDVDGMGFSYGQAFGYSMLVLLLAGVIVGIGMALLQHVIDPSYFDNLIKVQTQAQLDKMGMNLDSIPEEQLDVMNRMQGIMRHPMVMVFSGVLSTALVGGLVALITSVFVRRQPQPFARKDEE